MNKSITTKNVKNLSSLAIDANEHNYPERYTLLYHDLLTSNHLDVIVPFYISDLKEALSELSVKEKKIISTMFGLSGGPIKCLQKANPKDIAFSNMIKQADNIIQKLRSLKYLYIYSPLVKRYMDLSAEKVWDPENKYDVITKVKYLEIYYIFLLNYHKFYFQSPDLKFSIQTTVAEIDSIMLPFAIVDHYKYFSTLPSGDILIPMIQQFLNIIDPDLREKILEYAQLTTDLFQYKNVMYLRELKEKLFPDGDWRTGIDFFRLSSIQNISISKFDKGLKAFRKHIARKDVAKHQEIVEYLSGKKSIDVFDYSKDFSISDLHELDMFIILFQFLDTKMPSMPLGRKKIPFCDSCLMKNK